MIKLHHVFLAAALCVSFGAGSAAAAQNDYAPGNQPLPGSKARSNAMTATGLGMAMLGARVAAAGTLTTGAGATGASHLSAGTYEVDFDRDVSACFYSAAGFTNLIPIDVEPRSGNANGVFIVFQNVSGTMTDSQFYLTVFCNQ